jgi:hypothetical protein
MRAVPASQKAATVGRAGAWTLFRKERAMSSDECKILAFFRHYDIGPDEMLFFNPGECKVGPTPFRNAMDSLISRGLVIKERPKQAYSLTRRGYHLSLSRDVRNCMKTKESKTKPSSCAR